VKGLKLTARRKGDDMQCSRRALFSSLLLGLLIAVSGTLLRVDAATFPAKPITLVIPFPPGGGTDTIGRPLASVAPQHLGQPLVVINKAGGSGGVGAQFVAHAKPDGYTLLYGFSGLSEMPQIDALLGRPPAFKKEQFIPIGQFAVTAFAITVHAEARWQTFQAFVEEARHKPDELQYGSVGVYSTVHIMWEKILRTTGMRLRHIPMTGGGPVLAAVLGQHVDIGHCVVPAVCAPQVEAGKIRLLAVSSAERSAIYPDVPTLRELGYDVVHTIWHALMAPAGTPPDMVATLRRGLRGMVEDEGFKGVMAKLGERPQYMSGEAFEQFWEQDYQETGAFLRQIIKP
jgi:tripartite-type tricarboxylate transporter receptor subunit TctC